MDRYIPLDQRQRGLALARTYENAASNPQLAAGMIGNTAPRSTIVNQELPPSSVGAPPVPVNMPKPPVATDGNWRIQLGAFSNQANAVRAWESLAGRLGGLSVNYVRAGNIVRLQAGPLADKAAAQRACAASGTSCLTIAP